MPRLFPYLFSLYLALLFTTPGSSQGVRLSHVDSVLHSLDTAKDAANKASLLLDIARCTMDRSKADEYANQAIELAQFSRDQRLIGSTYIENGRRYLNNSALADNVVKGIKNFQQAETVAKENGFEDLLVETYCGLSEGAHWQGNDTKALACATQALAVAAGIDNDREKVFAYNQAGAVYQDMNQMLLALRNFLNGLDVAEKSGNPKLLWHCYVYLRYFYEKIGEYDKAIDYSMKAYAVDRSIWDEEMVSDLLHLGDMFLKKDQPDLALKMYQQSINVADTLRFDLLKFNGYHRTFLLYLKTQQYSKGLTYLYSHPDMLTILREAGFDFYVGQLLATNYTEQGRYDSAYYYFRRAEPEAVASGVAENLFDFYMAFGEYFEKTHDLPQAISYCNKAYGLAASTGQLIQEESSTDSLERLYAAVGNYSAALECNKRGAVERDSLRTQLQATDLMKLEVENDSRRRERLAEEERARTEHRHNVQYMGFTMGLVVLFVALVMLGRLKVPVSLIRALVFVAFIFLFEFIIMLADKQIQGWTEEEPWKVLLLKIILAAGMVPLHHWLEHKVVHYLSHRKKVAATVPAGGVTA